MQAAAASLLAAALVGRASAAAAAAATATSGNASALADWRPPESHRLPRSSVPLPQTCVTKLAAYRSPSAMLALSDRARWSEGPHDSPPPPTEPAADRGQPTES